MVTPEQFLTRISGRISLDLIDAVVSARLGITRVRSNTQPAVSNRQVAMYLAKYVGGWSTTAIGRFYNGRDHSTVCYSIKRVESKRRSPGYVSAASTRRARSPA
jgi:chromosomal replication initiation ATPase DnaA